jgi:hypothetical protein
MPAQDLLGKKAALGVVAPEPLVIEVVGHTRARGLGQGLFGRRRLGQVAHDDPEGVAAEHVGPHGTAQEAAGLEPEVVLFTTEVAAVADGDELGGPPVLVLLAAIGDGGGRDAELARQPAHEVGGRPTRLGQEVDAVGSGRDERQLGLLLDDEVFRPGFDHPPIINNCGTPYTTPELIC